MAMNQDICSKKILVHGGLVHDLIVDNSGRITDYKLRIRDAKTKAVKALQGLNLKVIAAGDSYNDTGMLKQAEAGILFKAPTNVIEEFPQFPVTRNYEEFKKTFIETAKNIQLGSRFRNPYLISELSSFVAIQPILY